MKKIDKKEINYAIVFYGLNKNDYKLFLNVCDFLI